MIEKARPHFAICKRSEKIFAANYSVTFEYEPTFAPEVETLEKWLEQNIEGQYTIYRNYSCNLPPPYLFKIWIITVLETDAILCSMMF